MIWVQQATSTPTMPRGSAEWDLAPAQLCPRRSEPLVHKQYGDSFEATDLESLLAERAVGR